MTVWITDTIVTPKCPFIALTNFIPGCADIYNIFIVGFGNFPNKRKIVYRYMLLCLGIHEYDVRKSIYTGYFSDITAASIFYGTGIIAVSGRYGEKDTGGFCFAYNNNACREFFCFLCFLYYAALAAYGEEHLNSCLGKRGNESDSGY